MMMPLEQKNAEEKEKIQILPKEQTRAWETLDNLEKNCVIALCLSNSVREAEQKFRSLTGKGKHIFYNVVYPEVKEVWKEYSNSFTDIALMRLKAGAIDAVDEMIDEIKHPDVEIRHKASKVIIDNVVSPKKENGGGPTFNAPVQFNFDKYKK